MNKKVIKITVLLLVVVALVFVAFRLFVGKPQLVDIVTEKVGRASISNTVTATGTLNALVTVEVGTQVSGKISKLYADYNSKVKKGQLLARLDTETLESTLESSKASLDLAQAEFDFQKANYERNKKLIEKNLIAQKDFDEVEYNYKSAKANLSSAKAKYNTDKTNLNYAYIYSPIDGIVLEKNIEEGETVASSFETPTLFTIANDLTQMEIETDVDEADIGQIKQGQRVEFTVDAFPDMVFDGRVEEIHLMPTEDANVVTYTVIINAPNPEQLLMPGMTANASFFVTEKKNILVVPNRAVEFSLDMALLEIYQEMNPGVKVQMPANNQSKASAKTVWFIDKNTIYAKEIVVGETDEINYEVLSGDIKEGMDIITSMTSQIQSTQSESSDSQKSSPFMPTPPGRDKKK